MAREEQAEKPGKKPEEKSGEKPGKPGEWQRERKKIEEIIRIAETNLDGSKPVKVVIRNIKGVSCMLSNAISRTCGFGDKKLADLTEQEQKTLEGIITNPEKHGIPRWLYNRRRDPFTGEDRHLAVSRLDLMRRADIDALKKKRCYRGIRHELGLPVRGQRTRSSFRKGGKAVGVRRKSSRNMGAKK